MCGIHGGPRNSLTLRGHQRDPYAVNAQFDHLGRPARSHFRLEPPDGKLQRCEHLVERRFPLGVQDSLS